MPSIDYIDLLEALVKLGLPMAVLSWLIFSWLYSSGEIDRDADRKALGVRLKAMKKGFKAQTNDGVGMIYNKWRLFGSGFYGLAALWTFLVVEVLDLLRFLMSFPGPGELFQDGVISFFVALFLNQMGNGLTALLWFNWWPANSVLVWVIVAYGGYWLGLEVARRNIDIPIEQIRKKFPPAK